MLFFPCSVCGAQQSTDAANAGLMIRCTQCASAVRVPAATNAASSPGNPSKAQPPAGDEDDDLIPLAPIDDDDDEDQRASMPASGVPYQPPPTQKLSASSSPRTPAAPAPKNIASPAKAPTNAPSVSGAAAATMTATATATKRITIPAGLRPPVTGKRYGFNCVYCSSRLEATDNMAAQEGQCPTCGNTIIIPILDRYGRLIDPITRQIIKQDPHPVHAYAAAGQRAPKIVRQATGQQIIICPRCGSASAITSNNCKNCGMPFTMEGTTLEAAGSSNAMCLTSLVLGIIGIPVFCSHILPILAIIFGIIGLNQVGENGGGGRGMAIAGIICGGIGLVLLMMWYLK